MAGKNIEFEWVEKGEKDTETKITIKAELESDKLEIGEVLCLPSIVCLTCGSLDGGPTCPKLA